MFKWISIVLLWTLALSALIGLQTMRHQDASHRLAQLDISYQTLSENYKLSIEQSGRLIENQAVILKSAERYRQLNAELQQTASTRLQTIRRLQYENESLRDWADHPLPGIIIGLHEHPSFTTAADYHQYMQRAGTLHLLRDTTAHERRAEPGS